MQKATPSRSLIFFMALGVILLPHWKSLDAFEGQGCNLDDKTCGTVVGSREARSKSVSAPPKDGARPWHVKGSDHASVTIMAYLDFLSPASAKAVKALDEVLKRYPDDLRLLFKPYPSQTSPEAMLAQEAAWAAGEQKAFWKMSDFLFAHKGEVTEKVLLGYAQQLKLDTKPFSSALTKHRFRADILQEIMEAKGLGVTQAPTLFINGRKLVGARSVNDLTAVIDEALGLKVPLPPPQPSAPEESSIISLEGTPDKGPEDAPVVIIEFSDFQCPFCARVVPTLREVMNRYPKQVRLMFKHFPLDFHPDAPLAHTASLAAGEQGKFWEMHDLIFSRQQTMKRESLIAHAKELGLNVERFIKDLDSPKYQNLIDRDIQEGRQVGVDGTPTFFINGQRFVGARPLGDFITLIEEELKLAPVPSSP